VNEHERSKTPSARIHVSRRSFGWSVLSMTAVAATMQGRDFLAGRGWLEAAEAAPADLIHDTFNALLAFVVPGSDEYSIAQGMSTAEPGGVDAGAIDVLLATLDETTPFVPQFSMIVAGVFNGLAQVINPSAAGPFPSPFARLSFAEKAAVFQIMDATDSLKALAGILPAFVAFFCYSEAGSFDPATRSLTGPPLGWRLSSYRGVADGRAEFLGYFRNRREVR
jgi:hypothetical protein